MASCAERRLILLGAWALVARAFLGCDSPNETEVSAPRMLDRICKSPGPNCQLSGSARLISGTTPDSVAIRLGPGPGRVVLRPENSNSRTDFSNFQALARGSGSLTPGAVPKLTDEFLWHSCSGNSTEAGGNDSSGGLVLADTSQGQEVEILDVRLSYDLGACSVVHPGRR